MGSKKYYYYLVWKDLEIPLFESQFRFLREDQCLRHYEKGIAGGIFDFNRAGIDQVWSELALWGLIGRIYTVELVRILCAFGCEIGLECSGNQTFIIKKSFWPVTYYIAKQLTSDRQDQGHISLSAGIDIPLYLEIKGKRIIGHFYTSHSIDADTQFPIFCKILEQDECLPPGSIRNLLVKSFLAGEKIIGKSDRVLTLAAYDKASGVIRGYGKEDTLYFLGLVEDKKAA